MIKRAVAILSTENLVHNVSVIKKHARSAKIIGMVKANAYGHGIRSISLRISSLVDILGVASIEEAVTLRSDLGIVIPILLMQGFLDPDDLYIASEYDLDLVIHDQEQLRCFLSSSLKKKLNIWIKVNTGLSRLGFRIEELNQVYENIKKSPNAASLVRIISHLACAENIEHDLNHKQISLFKNIVNSIDTEFSLCNSAGIFNFSDCCFDYVRPGLALYGVSPIPKTVAQDYDLKPVMTLSTILMSIQNLKKGECVGYSAEYVCSEDMLVGIASFGYGDGYPINCFGKAQVLLKGKICNVVGRVSMDMLAIDLRYCTGAKVGDEIVLWGAGLPVENLAFQTQNSPYNLLTGVQNRVKFIWR